MTSLDDLETIRITPFKQLHTGTLIFLYAIVPTITLATFISLCNLFPTKP